MKVSGFLHLFNYLFGGGKILSLFQALAIVLLLQIVPIQLFAQFTCETTMSEPESESCYQPMACGNTVPFSNYWDDFEGQIVVKVNFHFVKTANHGINFSATPDANGWTGKLVAKNFIDKINNEYAQNMPDYTQFKDASGATLPSPIPRLDRQGFPVPNLSDTKIRLELYTDPTNSADIHDGVWYHIRDDYHFKTASKATATDCPDCGNQTTVPLTDWKDQYSAYGEEVIDIFMYDEYWNCESCYLGRGRAVPGYEVFGIANIWHAYNLSGNLSFSMAGTIWHELGHMFNLGHTDGSECCQADERDLLPPSSSWNNTNNVMGQNACGCFYAPCQLDEIHNFAYQRAGTTAQWLELVGNYDEIEEIEETYPTIEITEEIEWDSPMEILGNIWIKPGGSLTIKSTEIGFAEKSIIQVDRGAILIVDDSRLYNLCSNNHWLGIRVAGNTSRNHPDSYLDSFNPDDQDPGRVAIINNSQIYRARWAIVTDYAFDYREDHWGGYIFCKDSEFRNCHRAAAFMKYDKPNKSIFYNVKIEHTVPASFAYQYTGSSGVSLWATHGVTFTKCHFHQLDAYGIFTIDGSFFVDSENRFTDIKGEGVHLSQSHSLSHMADVRIGTSTNFGTAYNEFNGNFNHIRISGYGGLKFGAVITRNEFKGTFNSTTPNNRNISILADGKPSINVYENKFEDNFVSVSVDNSLKNQNLISNNIITNSSTGIWYKGSNDKAAFSCNSFSIYPKAAVYVNGTINPSQGSFTSSPANYWDRRVGAGVDIYIEDREIEIEKGWTSLTSRFDYFYKPDELGFNSPYRPKCNLDDQSFVFCPKFHSYSTPTSAGLQECEPYENVIEDGEEMTLSLSTLRYKVDSLISNVLDYQTNPLYLKFQYAKGVKIEDSLKVLIQNVQYSDADALLASETEIEYKRMRYSLKLMQSDSSGSMTLLNALPVSLEDDIDFYETQLINIKRLFVPQYQLEDTELVTLENIALKSSSSGAYAKAILTYYNARSWDMDYPIYPEDSLSLRPISSNNIVNQSYNEEIRIYPNPSDGKVRIEGINKDLDRVEITVFSLLGDMVYNSKQNLSRTSTILDLDFSALKAGFYLLTLNGDDKKLVSYPLIIQK